MLIYSQGDYMRNFILILVILFTGMIVADTVCANTLQGLYTDYSNKQTPSIQKANNKPKHKNNDLTQTYNEFVPSYSIQNITTKDTNAISKQGSLNYGQYATKNKLTNPIRIDNPYNHLNEKYMPTQEQVESSSINFDGDAVKFKKGADGNIYGYNRYGRKVGIYRLNSNGTTTQFDTQGNRMGTFK